MGDGLLGDSLLEKLLLHLLRAIQKKAAVSLLNYACNTQTGVKMVCILKHTNYFGRRTLSEKLRAQ